MKGCLAYATHYVMLMWFGRRFFQCVIQMTNILHFLTFQIGYSAISLRLRQQLLHGLIPALDSSFL